jgi:hypothetical protein
MAFMTSCFLCTPNQDWIYEQDDEFFAMLGLGPIVEGYSLLATKSHTPSMLDLSFHEAEHLVTFTERIKQILKPHYGDVVITEHGRVAPCVDRDRDRKEFHCFHAHRLIFPTEMDLSIAFSEHNLETEEYPNFIECWRGFSWKGEYLYYERADGSCLIAPAPMRLVRQFFRYKVAEYVGHPELADWAKFPQLRVLESARKRLLAS